MAHTNTASKHNTAARWLSGVLLLALLAAFPAAHADRHKNTKRMSLAQSEQTQKKKTISAKEAARQAKDRHGGKVLKVQKKQSNEKTYYKVKILKESGRVITVDVDE